MKNERWPIMLALIFAVAVVPAAFAQGPSGAGPSDPLYGTGSWQTIQANATLWYYFDYTGDRSSVEIDLDANGVTNLQLKVLTPAQASAYVQDPTTSPVGIGTPPGSSTAAAIHDLVWLGAFNFPGRFFAVVVNNNSFPTSVRVTISGTNVTTAPTPTPTRVTYLPNPYATKVPTGSIQGRLVFQQASGGNIYTMNGDGTGLAQVTYGLDPSWSPDGKRITFSRWDAPAGLYIANANGSNVQQLYGAAQLLSPQWSPDGSRIAFTRPVGGSTNEASFCFRGMCFTSPADPHWKLGTVDTTSQVAADLVGSYHAFSPTWGSDSQTVAYADAQFGVLATNTMQSSGSAAIVFGQNPAVQSTSFSPDGTKIAFQVKQSDHYEINWMNADGSNVTAVTYADPLSFQRVNNVAPTWSPDSKQILFLSDRNGAWEFFVVNLDGSGLTQVLKNMTDSIPISYNFSNERIIDWTK